MLNKIKTNPFASVIWLMLACVVHIVLFKAKNGSDYQPWQRVLMLLVAICLTLPIHELVHFAFMKMFCKGRVQIKIMKSPMGLPALCTTAQAEFKKWQLVIIYLAPFVFVTLLIDVILTLYAEAPLFFFIVSVCNCAGCFYDILDVLIVVTRKDNGNPQN